MENKRNRWRPQIIIAMLLLGAIGITIIFQAPAYIDKVTVGVVTSIGMLGIKLLEGE